MCPFANLPDRNPGGGFGDLWGLKTTLVQLKRQTGQSTVCGVQAALGKPLKPASHTQQQFGFPTQDFFNFIQGDPSLLAGIPQVARVAAYCGGFPIKVDGAIMGGAICVSGGTVQNDVNCAQAAFGVVK